MPGDKVRATHFSPNPRSQAYGHDSQEIASRTVALSCAVNRLGVESLRDVHDAVYWEQRTRLPDTDLKSET